MGVPSMHENFPGPGLLARALGARLISLSSFVEPTTAQSGGTVPWLVLGDSLPEDMLDDLTLGRGTEVAHTDQEMWTLCALTPTGCSAGATGGDDVEGSIAATVDLSEQDARVDALAAVDVMLVERRRPWRCVAKAMVVSAAAAGGAGVCGSVSGFVGGATGSVAGAALGVFPAVFTFGLSIPVGAAIGGASGFCAGAACGSTVGVVAGGTAGYRRVRNF